MNIKKIIQEEIKSILENYPAGAKHDPNAPWNQEDVEVRSGEKADKINFEVIWYSDGAGFLIVKDKKDRLYAVNTDSIDEDDLEPYADREVLSAEKDEDGFPDYEYGEIEIDGDVMENYINDNLSSVNVGKGLSDFEDGEYMAVEIDDEIKQDLMGTAKYIDNIKAKQNLLDILGGINEVAEKIIDTPTMDTPTGTLFTINMDESDMGTIDNSIIDYNRIKQKAKEESKEGYVVHVNVGEYMGDIFFKTSDWFDSSETIASYENGIVVREENFENETEILEWIQDHSDNDEY